MAAAAAGITAAVAAAAGIAASDNDTEAAPAAEAVAETSEGASEATANAVTITEAAEAAESSAQAVQQAASEETAKAATAGGWTCECGAANNGNFCTNCGKPKPASSSSASSQTAQAKAAETAQKAAPEAAAPEAAATLVDDDGVPAYVPPANSPYNTGNIAAAFAEIPEENSAASLDLDENVIPDVSEALVAALATTNVSRSDRAYTQNIPQPEPEVQEEEQLDEIELAIPVRTADEILEEAYANGLDPKVSEDEVTGIKFIDFSDSL